jgi:hypothetical protein
VFSRDLAGSSTLACARQAVDDHPLDSIVAERTPAESMCFAIRVPMQDVKCRHRSARLSRCGTAAACRV